MPLFSIIVPVYNVQKYVSRCLDSLRRQTLDDIEIICVNDGSTDDSLEVVEMHAFCDSRIRVIDKQNGGLSSARNAGLEVATGRYILFVDSDDYLESNACEVIASIFESSGADVVTFGANRIPQSASNQWTDACLTPKDHVFSGFSTDLLFDEGSHPYIWRTSIKRRFLEESSLLFDEEVKFGEDQVFYFDLYALSSKTVLSSKLLYNYQLSRKGSLMEMVAGERESKVPEHLKIVEAILVSWRKRGLLNLCPVELMDWILDFLFEDIYYLNEDARKDSFRKLGLLLSEYFDNPEETAKSLGGHANAVVQGLVSCGKEGYFPPNLGREYTLFRIGWLGYIRNIFLRVAEKLRRPLPENPEEIARQKADLEKCEEDALASIEALKEEFHTAQKKTTE